MRFGNPRPGFEFWLYNRAGFEVSGKSHTSQNLICETREIRPAFPTTALGFCECRKLKYIFGNIW